MKAICVATSNRPDRVRAFMRSLAENHTEGWHLFASMEPGCPEIVSIINDNHFIGVSATLNARRLGPDLNTFMAHWMAIEDGAEALVYFDDDMVLSPDALDLCNWYIDHPEYHNTETHVGLCLCTEASDPTRPNSVSPNDTWRGLVGQGYCYMRPAWNAFVKRNWFKHEPHFGGDSYDWALGHSAIDQKKIILRPRLSRTQHTGVTGFHGGRIFPEHISCQSNTTFVLENE